MEILELTRPEAEYQHIHKDFIEELTDETSIMYLELYVDFTKYKPYGVKYESGRKYHEKSIRAKYPKLDIKRHPMRNLSHVCARCGSRNVKRLVYGLLDEEQTQIAEKMGQITMGCVHDPELDPDYFCPDCKYQWRRGNRPAVPIEMGF